MIAQETSLGQLKARQVIGSITDIGRTVRDAFRRDRMILAVLKNPLHGAATPDLIAHARMFVTTPAGLSELNALAQPLLKIKIKRRTPKHGNPYAAQYRSDVEISRLAVALHLPSENRLADVMRERIRHYNANGIGRTYIERDELPALLAAAHIVYHDSHINGLLRAGNGIFWQMHGDRAYLFSRARTAANLVKMALVRGKPGLIEYDRPGTKDMYIPLAGTVGQYCAHVYAAWIAAHDGKMTISRQTQSTLWNRSKVQIREWERLAKVTHTPNYAQSLANSPDTPAHAYVAFYRTSAASITPGWAWRRPNTYHAPMIRQHGHGGQRRKVRKAVNALMDEQLPSEKAAEAHPLHVRNFDTFKAFRVALRRRAPTVQAVDYLRLGQAGRRFIRRRVTIWEHLTDIAPRTSVNDYLGRMGQRLTYSEVMG